MSDLITYTFKIQDFTPASMPFARLVDYYQKLERMLGVADNIHLLSIVESSHGSQFAIERNHEYELIKRCGELREGTAPPAAMKAQEEVNKMLLEDGTSAAFLDPHSANVIDFPGKRVAERILLQIRTQPA
jgi:hypothetical protein